MPFVYHKGSRRLPGLPLPFCNDCCDGGAFIRFSVLMLLVKSVFGETPSGLGARDNHDRVCVFLNLLEL